MSAFGLNLNNVFPPVPQNRAADLQPVPSAKSPDTRNAPQAPVADNKQVMVEQNPIQESYDYNNELNQVIITLKQADGEVVQQIPSEKILQMLQSMVALDHAYDGKG